MGSNQAEETVEVVPSTLVGGDLLNSWKEIARYLGRGVRTVQRWKAQLGLPVRSKGGTKRSRVVARRSEIDDWLIARLGPVSEWNGATRRNGVHPDRGRVKHHPLLSPQALADFSQLQHKFRKNMDDFIRVEVEIGFTFAAVGFDATDAAKRARNLRSARKAYRTAYQTFAKYDVSSPDLRNEIVDRLADLRALLEGGPAPIEGSCAVLEIVARGRQPGRAGRGRSKV